MTRPREASSHGPAYVQGSPIGQLWIWATGRKGLSNDENRRAKPFSPNDEGKSGRCAAIQEASIGIKSAPREEHAVEVQRSEPGEVYGHERHSEAHDWGLARRVVVAGIICWYT
jgi:hypothetical protein